MIVDTGVFVALFDKKDKHHLESVKFLERNQYSVLISSEPVVTETIYILDFDLNAQMAFLKWLSVSAIRIVHQEKKDFLRCMELMEKYASLPMDFADASLVNLMEMEGTNQIATFDGDFMVHRLNGKQKIENKMSHR